MRTAIGLPIAIFLAVVLIAPPAQAGSITIRTSALQFHFGDILVLQGDATANASVHMQVFDGSSRLASNYTLANRFGGWLGAMKIKEDWGYGRRIIVATDIMTSDFASIEIEIVKRPEDVAADALAIALAWERVFWLALGTVFIFAVMAILITLGYASFMSRRISLRQALGRLGAWIEAWHDRYWWQLTTALQSDGNYLDEGTRSGMFSLGIRRAKRRKRLALADISQAENIILKAETELVRAETDMAHFQGQYDTYLKDVSRPAFRSQKGA